MTTPSEAGFQCCGLQTLCEARVSLNAGFLDLKGCISSALFSSHFSIHSLIPQTVLLIPLSCFPLDSLTWLCAVSKAALLTRPGNAHWFIRSQFQPRREEEGVGRRGQEGAGGRRGRGTGREGDFPDPHRGGGREAVSRKRWRSARAVGHVGQTLKQEVNTATLVLNLNITHTFAYFSSCLTELLACLEYLSH